MNVLNTFWHWMCVYTFGHRSGVGGDPDFRYHYLINHLFLRIDEELLGDGHSYSPRAIHSWLTRAMYSRRSKMNPLWNTMVIGGYADGERYLITSPTTRPSTY